MKKIIITNKSEIPAEGTLHSNHCKSVACYKTDGSELRIFSSVRDAADKLGINPSYISTCMNDRRVCKGYKIVSAREIHIILEDIVHGYNANANDARKWQQQEAEKEAVRKAEELRIANIAKLEAKERVMNEKYMKLFEGLAEVRRELMELRGEEMEEIA